MRLYSYQNGGSQVEIFSNGTKIRSTFDPGIPPEFPEQMDLKITDWCDAGCAWCHEKSTTRGVHGDVRAMVDLLRDLPAGVEIAIGGGDPLSHPEFSTLVTELSAGGLLCNVTVNARHFARHQDVLETLIEREAIRGVGISYHERFPAWGYEHVVHHMIVGVDDPEVLFQSHGRKILLLGYKSWGRGSQYEKRYSEAVKERIALWYRLLPLINDRHDVSFDNLAIQQMNPSRFFYSQEEFDRHYMGKEGEYSLYVDGVKQEYATSSYAPDRSDWTNIKDMFQDVRRRDSLGF